MVSKRTVEKHIANILAKRAFTNRAQVVRWAIETGLVKSTERDASGPTKSAVRVERDAEAPRT